MKIVFIGIQWSWKWTQARLLEEKYWFKLYETWWALREIAGKDSELWKLVKATIERWDQVSPEIVEDILADVIKSNEWKSLILDWFVRNEWNKISVDKIVWEYKVIFFKLEENIAKSRLLWRMYDKETWETFPSWTLLNPKNWNKLEKRSDDEENSINTRIRLFFEKTMPIVDIYKNEWKLVEIDANWSIEEIHERIVKELWL